VKRILVTTAACLALVLGAFLIAGDSAAATGKCWSNSSGQCYHWARTSNPFALQVENDVSAAWRPYYLQALADWSNSSAHVTPVVMTEVNQNSPSGNCGAITGKDRVCNKKYGFNGWLGLASIWLDSNGHIVAGTVKLNDSYFNTSTYNTPGWRLLVTCQELGHTIGLDHQDENFNNANLGTCMDYTAIPAGPPPNYYPNQDDYDELNLIYAQTDSYNSYSISSPAAAPGNGKGAANGLGEIEDAVPPGAGPQDGDLFVRHLNNGMTLITHVFWADRGQP